MPFSDKGADKEDAPAQPLRRTAIIMAILPSCPACGSGEVRLRPKLGDWTCLDCRHCWIEGAREVVREVAGVIELREPELPGFDRLPYPVALTAQRLADAIHSGGDPLKGLFALKDCFEATIKYLGIVLLTEYFSGGACSPGHSEALLERMVRPSLGDWVSTVVRDLSEWLIAATGSLGRQVAGIFTRVPSGRSAKSQPTDLWKRCSQFVEYRNDALGHGATRRDAVYRDDMERWLPLVRQLLNAVANLQTWRLLLVNDRDRCRVWMGSEPATATEPGEFRQEQIGHFVLGCRPAGERLGGGLDIRDLYPFICYVPDARQQHRLHYYDSIYRYQETRKDVRVLEYDEGFKQVTPEPVAGLERASRGSYWPGPLGGTKAGWR